MGKIILVVADQEEVLACVQAALEWEGYQAQTSRTETGRPRVPERPPDLVLLDVLVHPATGAAFAEWWQRRDSTRTIPLLMFSAQISVSQVLPRSQVPLFSVQPCHIGALLDAVRRLLVPRSPFRHGHVPGDELVLPWSAQSQESSRML
jgi:DNA-binding response OmpR family regulator